MHRLGQPGAGAARSTALSTRGPSTLGISMRKAAPSGNEVPRSRPVTPRPPSTSATQFIAALAFRKRSVIPNGPGFPLCRRDPFIRIDGEIMTLSPLITHRFPLEAYEEAYQVLRESSGPRGKIILDVTEP